MTAGILLGFFLTGPAAHAAGQKKVLLLDFKNMDQNPQFSYLETTITSAIREDLRKKFVFAEMPEPAWKKAAGQINYLWPEEQYTRGFALNLGLHTRQDIVIGGHFLAHTETGSRSTVIKTRIFLLDVNKRELISDITTDLPADGELFARVEVLATQVAKEAGKVLPGKGLLVQAAEAEEKKKRLSPYSFGLLAGTSLAGLPAAFSGKFTTSNGLAGKDFTPVSIFFYGDHRFQDLPLRIDATLGLQMGSRDLSVKGDSRNFESSLTDLSMVIHGGYEFQLQQWSFTPLLGAGYSFASVELDYTNLSAPPLSASGQRVTSDSLNSSAPLVEAGLRLEWRAQPRLALSLVPVLRMNFFQDKSVGQLLVLGGVGYRL